MRRRRLMLAGAISFAAGLVWQMPLAAVLPGVLEGARGRLLLGEVQGVWHDGSAQLICRTPDALRHDCGYHRLQLAREGLSPWLQLSAAESRVKARPGQSWRVDIEEMRLPAAALGAALPLAGQMQLGGLLKVTGSASGDGRMLGDAKLAIDWHGEIHGFPFAPQTLDVTGSATQASLRWRPTEGTPRFEGGVDCDSRGACSGLVHVRTDGRNAELAALLSVGGVRDPADPNRYEFRINVR